MCLKIRDIKEYILILDTWIVRFQIIISQEKINFREWLGYAQKSHDG